MEERREALLRAFGLSPSRETLVKILKLQSLLERGATLRGAIRRVGLGWKNYYKYAPVIYMSPRLLVPISKSYLRVHAVHFGWELVERIRLAVNEVVKDAVLEMAKRLLKGKIKHRDLGKRWLRVAQDLVKAWMHEVFVSLVEQTPI
ncbi:hypothetical protein ACSU1N_02265 [Thermogladius sp. 4427co]|uniref:hypothetical protein n=1 Tax=Thermogladius sp. 4427co TaxID=3450718 RepID=UPI003F7AACFA